MERFEFVCNLGEGAYGTVWKCRDRETEQMVAMKRFKDAHVDEEVMRLALREIRILKGCHHPNIVRMLEAFRSKSGRVYLVMEFVEHTLTEELRRNPRGFMPDQLKLVTWQLLQSTAYLHKARVIHRDLKPANILLNPNGEVKLCDFGFARNMVSKETAEYTSYVVTRWYRPPEILVGDMYGPAVDVWAIGCLFAEMATGRPLFPGRNTLDQLWLTVRTLGRMSDRQTALMQQDSKLCTINVPPAEELHSLSRRFPDFTPSMMQVLRACLHPDPEQRLTAAEIMQLPYFFDIQKVIGRVEAQNAKAAAASPPSPCFSDESPPPTIFPASSNTSCSRGSSMDCHVVSAHALPTKSSVMPMAPAEAASAVPAAAVATGMTTDSSTASPSGAAAVSQAHQIISLQRQPSNLSTSSCLRPLSAGSNLAPAAGPSKGSMDLRLSVLQANFPAQRDLKTAQAEQCSTSSAAQLQGNQNMYRSSSLGTAVPKYMSDGTERLQEANACSAAIMAGNSLKNCNGGPMVLVDARGSHLSHTTTSSLSTGTSSSHSNNLSTSQQPFSAYDSAPLGMCAEGPHSSDCCAINEDQQQHLNRCMSAVPAAGFAVRQLKEQEQQSQQQRRRSFGQAIRALGAKIEAFVHRPFATSAQ